MNMRWIWIENSDGKKDMMLSFATVTLSVVLFKVMFGGSEWRVFGEVWKIMPIDAATIGALLTPTLTAYVARRYTDRKFIDANNNGVDDAEEKKVSNGSTG